MEYWTKKEEIPGDSSHTPAAPSAFISGDGDLPTCAHPMIGCAGCGVGGESDHVADHPAAVWSADGVPHDQPGGNPVVMGAAGGGGEASCGACEPDLLLVGRGFQGPGSLFGEWTAGKVRADRMWHFGCRGAR